MTKQPAAKRSPIRTRAYRRRERAAPGRSRITLRLVLGDKTIVTIDAPGTPGSSSRALDFADRLIRRGSDDSGSGSGSDSDGGSDSDSGSDSGRSKRVGEGELRFRIRGPAGERR